MRNISCIFVIIFLLSTFIYGQKPGSTEYNEILRLINEEKNRKEVLQNRQTELSVQEHHQMEVKDHNENTLDKLKKDSLSLTSEISNLEIQLESTESEIRRLNDENDQLKSIRESGNTAEIEHQLENTQVTYDQLKKRHDQISKDIVGLANEILGLNKQKASLTNEKSNYSKVHNELQNKRIELVRKQTKYNSKKDSLDLFNSILGNAQEIKQANKKNTEALEVKLCQNINRNVGTEEYTNSSFTQALKASLDTIQQMEDLEINTPNVNQCKSNAITFITFSKWVQNAENVLNSDYDKESVKLLLSQSKQIPSNTEKQKKIKSELSSLLTGYCKKYEDAIDLYNFINELSSPEKIEDQINIFIKSDFKDYPYIVNEFRKKIKNTQYKCEFNNANVTCD